MIPLSKFTGKVPRAILWQLHCVQVAIYTVPISQPALLYDADLNKSRQASQRVWEGCRMIAGRF